MTRDNNMAKGLIIGLAISIPLWGLIIYAIRQFFFT